MNYFKLIFLSLMLFLLLLMRSTFACEKPVQKLNKGDAMPCTAWVVSESQMQTFGKQTKELELVKKENLTLTELGKVNNDIIKFHKNRALEAHNQLKWEETKSNVKSIGAFILGAAAASLAAYAALQATK